MNKSQIKVLSVFCFIISGLLLLYLFGQSYYGEYSDLVEENMGDIRTYIAIALIGLGIFLRKGTKK